MIIEKIKSLATKYFTDIGMIPENVIEPELLSRLYDKLKDKYPKGTPLGTNFSLTNKPVELDFLIFGGDACYKIDLLREKLINFTLDQNLTPKEIVEYNYKSENVVCTTASSGKDLIYLSLHSHKESFDVHSPKHPLILILISKK